MKNPLFFIKCLGTIILVLSVVQVVVSNILSTTGITLSHLEDEIRVLKKENSALSEQVLTASSLTRIASSASELGFVDSKSYVFVTAPLPLAQKR